MAQGDKYGNRSIGYLNKCEPVLKEFSIRTLYYAPTDISVLSSTIRDKEKQRQHVRNKTSKTMDSMHLPGANDLSRAVDLAPYIRGVSPWKLPNYMFEDIHIAGQIAAREMNLNIRSGICWNNLNQQDSLEDMLWAYRRRKREESIRKNNPKIRPFFDGPHFELYRNEYPD